MWKEGVYVWVCVCVFGQGVREAVKRDGKELQSPGKRSLAPYCSLVHMRINLVPVFDVNRR